jgi:tetratricopeptide (TPR) repeat protein
MVTSRYEWNLPQAENDFRRAIELSPGYAAAHQWLGECLAAMDRHNEAISELQQALDLDPLSPISNAILAGVYCFARMYDLAIEQANASLELEKLFWPALLFRGMAFQQKNEHEKAIETFQSALDASKGSAAMMAALGFALAETGRKQEAEQMLSDLTRSAQHRYVAPVYPALIALGVGDDVATFNELERAYQERSGWLIFLRVDPRFDRIRSDPRFQELLRKTGLLARGRTGDSSSSKANSSD